MIEIRVLQKQGYWEARYYKSGKATLFWADGPTPNVARARLKRDHAKDVGDTK